MDEQMCIFIFVIASLLFPFFLVSATRQEEKGKRNILCIFAGIALLGLLFVYPEVFEVMLNIEPTY